MTYAKIIADSIYDGGPRLTTMEVCFHRFVLAEFNTHRVFSRNSASSRAIPLAKQVYKVEHTAAIPVEWPAEQKGMQGGEPLDEESSYAALMGWIDAADDAVIGARRLGAVGVHKSIANRLLEPFQMHTVVVTATAWENFFNLRLDKMAQPEIRVAAEAMKEAYDASTPTILMEGLWHLPYVDDEDREYAAYKRPGRNLGGSTMPHLVKVSSARCARVSYETQAGKRDHQADLDLYERLTTNGHASPLEHVATPAPENQHEVKIWPEGRSVGRTGKDVLMTLRLPMYGNLLAWHQHRFDVEAARHYQSYS